MLIVKQNNMSTIEFNEALVGLETNLYSFAMSFTRNNEDARDLTQETILKAITYRKQYTPQTNFKAWVFTIMRNVFINQYRRKVKARSIFDKTTEYHVVNGTNATGDSALNIIAEKEITKEINSLAKEYKDSFELHFQGFKYQEIADKLDIPIGTVKSRIFVARKKLMEALPEYNYSMN